MGLDGSYLVRTETAAIVEAVTQAILLPDGRRDDIFSRHVPSCAFPINGYRGFLASTHNCFAEILI